MTDYDLKQRQSQILTEYQYHLLNQRMEIYKRLESDKQQYEDLTKQIEIVNQAIEDVWAR